MEKLLVIRRAKKMLQLGKQSECIEELTNWFDNNYSETRKWKRMHNELILISNKYYNHKKASDRGTAPHAVIEINNNKLVDSLLSFLDDFENLEIKSQTLDSEESRDEQVYKDTISFNTDDEGEIDTIVDVKKLDIELIINRDFNNYPEEEQRKLLDAIKNLLELKGDLRIKQKRRGSIKITLELTPDQCEKLQWAIKNGDLSEFDVIDSEIKEAKSSSLDKSVLKGRVTAFQDGDVVLDIDFKRDGIIPLSEFMDIPELKIGDTVDVYVEKQEGDRGKLILSRRKAKLLRAWSDIVDSYENGTVVRGTVISKTKGGLITDIGGLQTFLPGSQIDVKPVIDYDLYVGKTMELKVVKINESLKNAVVSHKAVIESDLAELRESTITKLRVGQILEGQVNHITEFGAFLDIGGVDGLLYITDISWGRVDHPSDFIELGQKLNVVVLDFNENRERISLGLKQLQPHPWDVLEESIVNNSTLVGTVVDIKNDSVVIEIKPGVEGIALTAEVLDKYQASDPNSFFELGQKWKVTVKSIERDRRELSLTLDERVD